MSSRARPERTRGDGRRGKRTGKATPFAIDGTLFSQGPVVIFRWSLAEGWPVEFVTENVADLFGHGAERFRTGEIAYASVIHPEDMAAVSAEVADHLKNGPDTFKHVDYRIVRPDGGERWIQDFTILERDADGWVHHANGYLVDITARKAAEANLRRVQDDLEGRVVERTAELLREIGERREAEAELARRESIQRRLNDAMTRLFTAGDWTAIIDGVLGMVGEAVGVDRVHVFENRVGSNDEGHITLRLEWTAPGIAPVIDSPFFRRLAFDSPVARRWVEVLGKGETLHAVARDLPEAEREAAAAVDMKTVLIVPVFVDDVWWGAIGFVDARGERIWSETDIRALSVLAGALGTAVRRRRDDEALRKSEQRLSGAVESLQEQIALFDADDRLVLCNEAFRRHNPMAGQAVAEGWTYEEILRANVRRGFLLDAIGREEAFIRERLIHHRNPTGPILRHLADGTVCLIRESRTPEGGTALTFIDITDLQNANDALRAAKTEAERSKALLQDALESATESFALYDAEGRLVVFNSAYQRLYRHSPELMEVGTTFEEILHARARDRMILDVSEDKLEEWIRWRLEAFFQASGSVERLFPDGSWWKVSEQRTATGGIAQIATDITEIKRREQALRESEERFRALFERTSVGAAITGPDFRYVMVNRAFCDLVGYPSEELLTMSPLDITHPDDQGRSRDLMEAFVKGAADTGTEEKRYIRKDGVVVWILVGSALIRDAEGKPAFTLRHIQDITERKRAEEALADAKTEAERSKALLQDALESATESFALYDAEGRLVVFNSAYQHLFRDTPELMQVGTSFEEILRERGRLGAIPDVRPDKLDEWIRWRLQTFFEASGPVERLFPDGTWRKVSEQRTATGGIAQIATDITEIKRREEALRDSEERFRALFERTAVGAAITGIDFRYVMVNQAFCDLLGYSRDELLTMTPLDITHPLDLEASRQVMEDLLGGTRDASVAEKRYVRKDGETVWALVSTTVVRDAAGKPAYTLRHIQDVSERRRAESATRRLQDELAHVSRVRTMGEMATGFAHELNQPLTAIVNYAQGGLRRHRSGAIGNDEAVRVLELVAAQAHRAGAIIRRIRRFVQKDQAEIGAVDINTTIREAVGFIGGDAMERKVEIGLHLADGLPPVKADAVQLQQVILNLARNAIEAIGEASPGGGRLDISTHSASRPDHVEVMVVDSGPGITEDVARQVFEPFFTTKPQGMGMGLAICRSIVESSGGRLVLDDPTPGRTTFCILLAAAGSPPSA